MGPNNVIMGDVSTMTDLPQMSPDTRADIQAEVKKKAKYSRSKEFAELKQRMEERIEFYQKYLPSGVPVATLSPEEAGKYYVVANLVIAELQQVIDGYESANEQVKELNA